MTPESQEQLLALPGATTLENRDDGLIVSPAAALFTDVILAKRADSKA